MSKNYHIAALGGGALVLAGLAYLGFSSLNQTKEELEFTKTPAQNDTGVSGLEEAKEATLSVKTAEAWNPAKIDGRVLNLLTSVDLFVSKDNLNAAIDLLEEPPVHAPIENIWWVKNGIDPGFDDSPDRDHDGDGYTNLEEHDAETDPANAKSYPALVHKLEVNKIETTTWVGILNSAFGNNDVQFKLEMIDSSGKRISNKMKATDNLGVGGLFFKKGAFKNRFKLLEIDEREIETRGGLKKKEKFAIVEDLKENKKGKRYQFLFRLKGKAMIENQRYDDIVHFRLNALGQEDKVMKVETNTTFSVTVDAKTETYKLLEVKRGENRKPTVVIVEYTKEDGSKATLEVPVR